MDCDFGHCASSSLKSPGQLRLAYGHVLCQDHYEALKAHYGTQNLLIRHEASLWDVSRWESLKRINSDADSPGAKSASVARQKTITEILEEQKQEALEKQKGGRKK